MTLTGWRFVGLLDEAVQHDNSLADERTKQNPRNAFHASQSKFEQTFAERLRMWLPEIGADGDMRRVSTMYLAASVSSRFRISVCTASL